MKAEIISVGTELLLGHIINTNAAFLGRELAASGIDLYRITTVGDNIERLKKCLETALERADIVITTGGLGPTIDDITIRAVSELTGKKLVLNRSILNRLNKYFRSRGIGSPCDGKRQAYVPEGAMIFDNKIGTAPGIIVGFKGKKIVCLPGPPREIEPIFTNDILPYITNGRAGKELIKSRTIKISGLPESRVNAIVKDLLILKPPTTVGIYAKLGEVDLKIMAKAVNEASAKKAIFSIEKKICARLEKYIFGYDNENIEDAVARNLFKKKKTIAMAESCTGGLISNRLTNSSGSSGYFIAGIVAYSNSIKERVIGVESGLIRKYGAVSKEVAIAMADGIRCLTRSDIGIGVTGIAGPTGGTRSKPVGSVYAAVV